jgi:hypothetical protein
MYALAPSFEPLLSLKLGPFGTQIQNHACRYYRSVSSVCLLGLFTHLPHKRVVHGCKQLPYSSLLTCPNEVQVAALKGYEDANSVAMNLWEEVYPDALLIALTDTFSSEAFFKVFLEPASSSVPRSHRSELF